MNDNEMKGEAKVSAEAEPPGLRSVVNRNGGDSRSGGEPLQTSEGAEMGVNPAEATARQELASMRVGNKVWVKE